MRRPHRHETPMGNCPHPGCDVPLRLVANHRASTLTIYHGEDELAEITPAPGHDMASMLDGMNPDREGYAALMRDLGTALAYATVELHAGVKV